MGSRYFFYRISHEIEKRIGRLKKRHPSNLKFNASISKASWINKLEEIEVLGSAKLINKDDSLIELQDKAEKILKGDLPFFNAEWISLGKDYDWITNPSNQYRYDISKHWSEIPDLSEEAGDIKYVWEKSRFSWVLLLLRYDYHFEKDLSEYVFSEIESWIAKNPINMGPNWRCSQEISLRIFNWINAIFYYKDSKAFTEERWLKIQQVIYASLHHVYNHINFSRIAVRNNHAITETLFLALSAIFFPYIRETKKWGKLGRKWFEEEIEYQIYEDGTFLQFSNNYHRVVIQLLTFGINISERAKRPFSRNVYDRALKSTEFLYQCLQESNGWLPNYGSNDGALFFPFSDTDYRDFRPQLNSLCYLLTGSQLFKGLFCSEEIKWWGIKPTSYFKFDKINKFIGIKEYPVGGYVLIRDEDTFTFIRCGSHKDRPAQADNLHIDIWYKGQNVFRDSGTFKYNTSSDYLNYFTGTRSHNTVSVNSESQMLKGGRFIWYYWTQKISSKVYENSTAYYFEGAISAFKQINKKGIHRRIVKKIKGSNKWEIIDKVENLELFDKEQIWHFNDVPFIITAMENGKKLEFKNIASFNSDYYGVCEKGKGIAFNFNNCIKTTIEI